MQLAEIRPEDTVVVSGCGPLGLGMVAAAKLKNPHKLIALDLLDWKVCVDKMLCCRAVMLYKCCSWMLLPNVELMLCSTPASVTL